MREPNYVMRIMASWMKLHELYVAKIRRDFIERSGKKEMNQYTCRNPFWFCSKYRHQVDDQKYFRHVPIHLERTWGTKFCPDHNFAWYTDVSEVNTALELGHFKNDGVVQPSLDF